LKRVRAWLRAFGPVRLLDDCAALMMIENGNEAEDDLRRALGARPPLIQRIALRAVLYFVKGQASGAASEPERELDVPAGSPVSIIQDEVVRDRRASRR
jgi:hypothetical protein